MITNIKRLLSIVCFDFLIHKFFSNIYSFKIKKTTFSKVEKHKYYFTEITLYNITFLENFSKKYKSSVVEVHYQLS
jgi:hypothetical protein